MQYFLQKRMHSLHVFNSNGNAICLVNVALNILKDLVHADHLSHPLLHVGVHSHDNPHVCCWRNDTLGIALVTNKTRMGKNRSGKWVTVLKNKPQFYFKR